MYEAHAGSHASRSHLSHAERELRNLPSPTGQPTPTCSSQVNLYTVLDLHAAHPPALRRSLFVVSPKRPQLPEPERQPRIYRCRHPAFIPIHLSTDAVSTHAATMSAAVLAHEAATTGLSLRISILYHGDEECRAFLQPGFHPFAAQCNIIQQHFEHRCDNCSHTTVECEGKLH
jgi:hypothetical protein